MLYEGVDIVDCGEVEAHASWILEENALIIQNEVINQWQNFFIQFKTEWLADKGRQKVKSVVGQDKFSFPVEIFCLQETCKGIKHCFFSVKIFFFFKLGCQI